MLCRMKKWMVMGRAVKFATPRRPANSIAAPFNSVQCSCMPVFLFWRNEIMVDCSVSSGRGFAITLWVWLLDIFFPKSVTYFFSLFLVFLISYKVDWAVLYSAITCPIDQPVSVLPAISSFLWRVNTLFSILGWGGAMQKIHRTAHSNNSTAMLQAPQQNQRNYGKASWYNRSSNRWKLECQELMQNWSKKLPNALILWI